MAASGNIIAVTGERGGHQAPQIRSDSEASLNRLVTVVTGIRRRSLHRIGTLANVRGGRVFRSFREYDLMMIKARFVTSDIFSKRKR